MVFDERWFKQNQWWLLPYVSHDRDNLFIGTNKPLIEIAPDHVSWLEEPGLVTTEFHVHHVYGRRLYRRLEPLWNLMHRIDMSSFGRAANLNFGFDTLTAYPDASVETDTFDGYLQYGAVTVLWATGHDATAASSVVDTGSYGNCAQIYTRTTTNYFRTWVRGEFLFKTSAIGAGTLSAATFSLMPTGGYENLYTPAYVDITSLATVSNTGGSANDYNDLGTTSFGQIRCTATTGQYADVTLSADGRSNIVKDGISKFGTWLDKDRANTAPTWVSGVYSSLGVYFADDTTANNGKDPKLVVTYSAAATFIPKCIFL